MISTASRSLQDSYILSSLISTIFIFWFAGRSLLTFICNFNMFSTTFILSLLASVATAQLPESKPLPSFAIVSSGATIEPPSTTISNSASRVPASESFNPSKAPAFTLSAGASDLSALPVFSSTPCASQIVPKPSYSATANLSIGQPVPTPGVPGSSTLKIPSSEQGPQTTTASPTITPTPNPSNEDNGEGEDQDEDGNDDDDETPCPEEEPNTAKPLTAASPIPTPASPLPPFPTTGVPLFPTASINTDRPGLPGLPSGFPGYGWGRPRPSGMWPSRGGPRPTGGFWHPRPTGGFWGQLPSGGFAKPSGVAGKPCTTFETRIRPVPTGV